MALRLIYITNRPDVAKVAEQNGVEWIFVDLEINGKVDRQGHLNTVISRHDITDVSRVKGALSHSEVLVRVNPIYEESEQEIDEVIERGAGIVMLPYFKTKQEVERFISCVRGRAKVCLLLETAEAVEIIDDILNIEGIDFIHIGLNDLHLSYGKTFMFELLIDGTVERLAEKIKQTGIPYGFGGIARLGQGALPAEMIVAEHHRLGSEMAILSRAFCNAEEATDIEEISRIFREGVKKLRAYEKGLTTQRFTFFQDNHEVMNGKVKEIVDSIAK
ncbi:aldolase/citrate lyase family protein [Salimicrobium halophilum]|uniref:HpcH/HpaI aldolase/citrate lyase family protein n=1 Tax=Salimicrobium halophilum TaxID=86666 RepID=A0A1G8SBV6_9BACI|nr:aldolase/citrate lyase family protein [Salimicrobium halophilum]SDJ26697.1 HpcH/HpaI aldolase/citrate lyase family protein [Salimicrobium halophilum]